MRNESLAPYFGIHGESVANWKTDSIHSHSDAQWAGSFTAVLVSALEKIVNKPNIPWDSGTGKWQPYNFRDDPGETRDLAAEMADKLAEMLTYWGQLGLEWLPLAKQVS